MLTQAKLENLYSARRNGESPTSNPEEAMPQVIDGEQDLAAIVAACQRWERSAQRELYEIFHNDIYRLMVRMVGRQDAPDLLQQVFLQTFRHIAQFTGKSRFKTWLYRLAVNESLQHLRRSRRRRHYPLEYDPMDESRSHEQNAEQKELLEKALKALDPELRSLFLLRETENLSYKEIAEVLQNSEGTVASRLNRARHELKKHLIDLGWDP